MAPTIPRGAPRPAALAGRWYPADATTLRADVARYFEAVATPTLGRVAAIVSPHAGMMYSGRTAAHAWSVVPRDAARIVMVGPAHRVPFAGVALGDFASFDIPGAEIPVDRSAFAALEEATAATVPHLVSFVPGAHDAEHCIEIQLPFAHAVLPHARLVPLLAGDISARDLAGILAHLLRPTDVLVISSDLSHFHAYDDARRRDSATLDAIARLATSALSGEDACGYRGIMAAALLAEERGQRGVVLDYMSSGDSGAGHDSVVGYGAVAFAASA